ncbi:MAG: hypothetical protein QNK37_01190 [Acidobacteriota bacterium]|nr:hypothetical protein [Acidobacteriota bacterium]
MTRKTFLILSGLCFAAYLPFITKGVNYDDFVFLDYARLLTKDPTRCIVGDYVWQGMVLKDLVVFESTHPPFIPYWIKTVSFFFGPENLVVLHLAFFPFLLLATLATADLIVRWCKASPYLALGLTLGPMFLPIATNLMTDTAMFAFWFTAITCWDRALERRWWSPWHLGAAAATLLACFTAYQALGLALVLPVMGLMRARGRIALVWTAAALLPFALWVTAIWLRYDFFPYFAPPREELSIATEVRRGMMLENMWVKLRVMLLYLGAGPGLFFLVALRDRKTWLILAGWALALTAFLFEGPVWGNNLSAWFWFTLGLAVIPLSLRIMRRFRFSNDADHAVAAALLVSAAGLAVFQVAVAAFAAPRYVFVLLGAAFLFALKLYRPPVNKSLLPLYIPLALSVIMGLLVTAADWRYAEAQRVELLDLPDADIHFVGEKGVKYSAQRAGLTYFLPGMEEDVFYLLVPQESDRIRIPDALNRQWEEVFRETIDSRLPIRTMNRAAGAGFFLHTRGLMPFVFSRERVEEYVLYRIFRQANPEWKTDPHAPPEQPFSVGEILPERPVVSEFHCRYPGLTRLRLFMATHQRVNQATLIVSLLEVAEDGSTETAWTQSISTATMTDNAWLQLDFPPLDSRGKTYRFTLESPNAKPLDAVTIWADKTLPGSFQVGDETMQGRLAMEAWCLPGRSIK